MNLKEILKIGLNFVLNLSSKNRKIVLIFIDILILILSVYTWHWTTITSSSEIKSLYFIIISFVIVLIGIPINIFTKKYNGIVKYIGTNSIYQNLLRNTLIVFTFGLILNFLYIKININALFILILILTTISNQITILFKNIILINNKKTKRNTNVAIYGAGEAGAQLAASLNLEKKHSILIFIDDDKNLWGRNIDRIKIIPPKNLIYYKNDIDTVLLAIPSLNIKRRKEIVEQIISLGLTVNIIPSIEELVLNKNKISSYEPIKIENLLGRDIVPFGNDFSSKMIKNKAILVTGAGGSIGSELIIQLLKSEPKLLILVEHSEINLFNIENKIKTISTKSTEIISKLGSCTNKFFIEKIFDEFKINIVFHAAAYKHVPLVEKNPIAGIYNNVFSTDILCKNAIKNNIEKFILISTDKAVRPSNVMGASKRLSELIVQTNANYSQLKNKENITKFTMVRFGNVLGSSGSVIPQFDKQIKQGGPITLTSKEVTRYFMTLKEAVHLVIEASFLTKGGEIFLLDMGVPVKILSLAKQMILLSGLTIKDESNKYGDIEIKEIGLRSGEKLFEELLINGESEITDHPLIFKSKDGFEPIENFEEKIKQLKSYIYKENLSKVFLILQNLVPEWTKKSN